MNLELLISQIQSLDGFLKHEANKAINRMLTLRNWLIGYYIIEYEQNGDDRAKYGDKLLQNIAQKINNDGFSYRNLNLYRLFYLTYPHVRQTLPDEFENYLMRIVQTPSAQFALNNISLINKEQTISYEAKLQERIINKLSFSHIVLLLSVENDLKRTFYAIEAIKGTWSVRELKKQIDTLLFERCGMSAKPEQLLKSVDGKAEKETQISFVKDIYNFDFLGLKTKDVVEESDLETALLDHLQQFLVEMGHGFCFEGRQKRILIGDEYFFIDLVFYHRVLKCHVLVDLKVDSFIHGNASQLNTYINYYKKEVQLPDDNAPVGILMVTKKNNALVEYATAGMDEQLFVRKYLLELPDKKELEDFIKNELQTL